MEVTFARAMDKGKVLKLRDLNAGFTGPTRSRCVLRSVAARRSHRATLRAAGAERAVRSYAEGIDTETALKRALNVSIDDLQVTFNNALETKFGGMRRALHDAEKPVDGRARSRH